MKRKFEVQLLGAVTFMIVISTIIVFATKPVEVPVPTEIKLEHLPPPALGSSINSYFELRMDNSLLIPNKLSSTLI